MKSDTIYRYQQVVIEIESFSIYKSVLRLVVNYRKKTDKEIGVHSNSLTGIVTASSRRSTQIRH